MQRRMAASEAVHAAATLWPVTVHPPQAYKRMATLAAVYLTST